MRGDGFPVLNRLSRLPRTRLLAFLIAAGLYTLIAVLIIVWLAAHGENTIQRRIAQSPSITVLVEKPANPAPGTTVSRSENEPSPPTDTPSPETDAPLLPVVKPSAETPPTDPDPASTSTPAAVAMPPPVTETPTVAQDAPLEAGLTGWRASIRPFNKTDKRPRIAILITNLGLSTNLTKMAVQTTPPDVTLAFQAMASTLPDWIDQARKAGHEVLLGVPMEPTNYPQNDPGPQTLLTTLPADTNTQRLATSLGDATQMFGITPLQGDVFVSSEKALTAVFNVLQKRDLVFVDSTGTQTPSVAAMAAFSHVPFAQADMVIDASANQGALKNAWTALEDTAKEKGQAFGVVIPYPAAVTQLNEWLKTLPEKGIVLAPVSALLRNGDTLVPSTPTTSPIKEPIKPNDLSAIKRH